MKTKTHLFRLTVAVAAFTFSTGCYAVWRYVQSSAPTAKTESVQIALPEVQETLPLVPEPIFEVKTDAPKIEREFDPEGFYYIADELPVGFEDFDNFSVMNKNYESEDESEYGKLIAPKGSLQTGKEFKFSRISIGSGQIQFETERIKGISYSFSGRFIETRNFIDLEAEAVEKVLEGRLIKKRKGVTIAERDVKFGWYLEAGCSC